MPTRHYTNLGPVKPWVQAAADELGGQFNIDTVYGFATRNVAGTDSLSDHALGLALDFMTYSDSAKQVDLANLAQAQAKELDIYYIICQQHIWDIKRDPVTGHFPDGWRMMPDRGSPTANHMDHVHISFFPTATGSFKEKGYIYNDPKEPGWEQRLANPLGGLGDILKWLGNGHNWYRVFLVLAGAIILGFALMKFDKVSGAVTTVGQIATKSKGAVE